VTNDNNVMDVQTCDVGVILVSLYVGLALGGERGKKKNLLRGFSLFRLFEGGRGRM
jgi:hypothetical protein